MTTYCYLRELLDHAIDLPEKDLFIWDPEEPEMLGYVNLFAEQTKEHSELGFRVIVIVPKEEE